MSAERVSKLPWREGDKSGVERVREVAKARFVVEAKARFVVEAKARFVVDLPGRSHYPPFC